MKSVIGKKSALKTCHHQNKAKKQQEKKNQNRNRKVKGEPWKCNKKLLLQIVLLIKNNTNSVTNTNINSITFELALMKTVYFKISVKYHNSYSY